MAQYSQDQSDAPKVKKPRNDREILDEAIERLKNCIDEYSQERKKQRDDLLFSTLEQWPSDIRAEREGDPNGPRPCLTIDQINQYIVQVVNDMRQNRPSVKVRPVDDISDPETAEVFQGITRQIEDQSSANVAYSTAGESAVRVGEGYFRFVTEYESEDSFDQVIRVRRIPDCFCVYLGPHIMPDGSDTEYGFVFEDMSLASFRRKYPGAKWHGADFNDLEGIMYWKEEKKIRVCEYIYCDYEDKEILYTADGKTHTREAYTKMKEKPEITGSRHSRKKSVKWCLITGVEILEKRDWLGKYIPIVKVTGKEAIIDGKRSCWGLVRPAKDSLRMYNYWASTITEKLALQPKTPFIGASGQFEGFEDRWGDANRKNFAYLEYNPVSEAGAVLPPPQRQQASPMEVAMIQQLQIIREDVQASLGMFKASLGKEQPNQSGKAILALTQESDTGVYHFMDNLAISIQHGGRILVDLVPKIYDTKRIMKIMGEDGKVSEVEIDPEQNTSVRELRDSENKIRKIYNLGVGTYDVTVTVGPSYNTKRMEAATLFTDLSNSAKDPISAAVVRYLAIKNSDFNGAEMAAEMLEKLLPPNILPAKDGEEKIPPRVAAQMQQMQQQMQLMAEELQKAKTGENAKLAQIELNEKEGMAELAVKGRLQEEELRLQREKVAEELRLEREVAFEKAKLAREVAEFEAGIEKEKVKIERDVKMDGLVPPEVRDRYLEGRAIETAAKPLEERIGTALQAVGEQLRMFSEKADQPKPEIIRAEAVRGKNGEMSKVRITRSDGSTNEIDTMLQ